MTYKRPYLLSMDIQREYMAFYAILYRFPPLELPIQVHRVIP
jgi:hypothetical protein